MCVSPHVWHGKPLKCHFSPVPRGSAPMLPTPGLGGHENHENSPAQREPSKRPNVGTGSAQSAQNDATSDQKGPKRQASGSPLAGNFAIVAPSENLSIRCVLTTLCRFGRVCFRSAPLLAVAVGPGRLLFSTFGGPWVAQVAPKRAQGSPRPSKTSPGDAHKSLKNRLRELGGCPACSGGSWGPPP